MASGTYGHSHEYRRNPAMNHGMMNVGSLSGLDSGENSCREKRSHEIASSLDVANAGFPELRKHGSCYSGGEVMNARGTTVVLPRPVSMEKQQSSTAGGSSDSLTIGLELGKRTYFGVSGGSAAVSATVSTTAAAAAPAKRGRATAPPTPRCQVEGCKIDLSSAKDYHRRHKVCALHSKTARVTVAGQEQRFCQQCSRFHGLAEFDEGKRSCRRRLAGHNERRRKPQPDTLALNARLSNSFPDSRRLGTIYTDRPSFLPHLRISSIPTLWDELNETSYTHGKGAWPRMSKFEDQTSFECPVQGTGMERQLFCTGLSQNSSDRSPILLLQSPKGMMPVSNDVGGQRMHHYLQGSVGHLGHSLTLSPSSGTGVLSGLEATPVSQGFARVSDSGRALSLQSTMQLWSSQVPVAVTLDMSTTESNMMPAQYVHDNQNPMGHPVVHGGQQHHLEWTNDKFLSVATNAQSTSSETGYSEGVSNSAEKNHLDGPFLHGLNDIGNYECHPMFCMLQGQVSVGDMLQDVKPTVYLKQMSQDVKPNVDLMRMSSVSQCQSTEPQVSSRSFQMGSNHLGELQALRSYESSVFDS